MLVISRRKGQVITIGDDIEVVITEVHRSSVKIGIKAPRGLLVLRKEAARAKAPECQDEEKQPP
jgi:carbon storage regulator